MVVSRIFTRVEFYDLVWSKPMTHLAKDFALSDVALHKICRKHDVPNPPLGWWAKKAAGKKVTQTPLPRAKSGTATKITIAGGDLRQEPDIIATARENARVLASSAVLDEEFVPHPFVERTAAKLSKAKPSPTGLVSIDGTGLIKSEIAPASVERFELALNRIVASARQLGFDLIKGETAAAFSGNGIVIGFSIVESVKREKHVQTKKENAEQEAWQRKRDRRWSRTSWDSLDLDFSSPQFAQWDYHPTGQLALELEHVYLLEGTPRRTWRDAKVQRLENMASDIAVGIVVLAAAKQEDRLRRDEADRRREEERQRREQVLRNQHINERQNAMLDQLLDEWAQLDRLRRMIALVREQLGDASESRVIACMEAATRRLAAQEAALDVKGLASRFEEQRLFGDDDDFGFRPPYHY